MKNSSITKTSIIHCINRQCRNVYHKHKSIKNLPFNTNVPIREKLLPPKERIEEREGKSKNYFPFYYFIHFIVNVCF